MSIARTTVAVLALTALAACDALVGVASFTTGPDGGALDGTAPPRDARTGSSSQSRSGSSAFSHSSGSGSSPTSDAGSGTGSSGSGTGSSGSTAGSDAGSASGTGSGSRGSGSSLDAGCASASIGGVVMDPGLNVGLAGITVYVLEPGKSPVVIADEPNDTAPVCDTCASLLSPALTSGVTGPTGSFSLSVPGAATYTVIAQIGRWRRIDFQVQVACGENKQLSNVQIAMPSSEAAVSGQAACRAGETQCGDIPKMAVVEGEAESLPCWLLKVGISSSEFAPGAQGTAPRIQLYNSATGPGESYWNGTAAVVPPSVNTLLMTLPEYSAQLQACDEGTGTTSAADVSVVVDYANAGGRLLFNHLPGQRIIDGAGMATATWNVPAVATWNTSAATPTASQTASILDVSPLQQSFFGFMKVSDTTDAVGTFTSAVPRNNILSVGADSTALATFATVPSVAAFVFDTPITSSNDCGRVMMNDLHSSATRSTTLTGGTTQATTFPASCATTALTPEELVLDYELFAMFDCSL